MAITFEMEETSKSSTKLEDLEPGEIFYKCATNNYENAVNNGSIYMKVDDYNITQINKENTGIEINADDIETEFGEETVSQMTPDQLDNIIQNVNTSFIINLSNGQLEQMACFISVARLNGTLQLSDIL